MSTDSTGTLVENLFRREFARIVAGLTRRFGVANLLLAEDAAQDALRKALEDWPYHGVPDRPEAWLWTVAQRQAITALRRERRTEVTATDPEATAIADPEASRDDDVLRLMGLCCDPILPQESQLALVLENVCGFGIPRGRVRTAGHSARGQAPFGTGEGHPAHGGRPLVRGRLRSVDAPTATPHWSDTPWPQILELYDRLVALCPSTIASLGRASPLRKSMERHAH